MAWRGGASTRSSLRHRLQVLVAGLVALLLFGGVTNLRLVDSRDKALDRLVQGLDPAIEALNVVDAALIDQQAAVSGFVLTGREETLEPYQRAVDRQMASFDRLEQLAAGFPAEGLVPVARARVEEWRRAIVAPELSAKRRKSEPEARALSVTGETVFATARQAVAEVGQSLRASRQQEQRSFDKSRQGITRAIVVNLVVAFLLVLLVTTFLRRWVAVPLEALRRSVDEVVRGDLEHVIEPSGPQELAQLGADVEAMRRRILSELEESRRAQEGLAQRAPLVVAVRDALAPATVRVPEGFTFASVFEPAEGVLAGDWYSVIDLGAGRIALCLGDVAGHGPAPAILALRVRELLVAALRLGAAPGEALALVATQLGVLEESFVTLVAAIVEPSGLFRYANAGHPPPVFCTSGGPVLLNVTGPLLGPLEGRWAEDELVLTHGAVLVCYTDGATEAADDAGVEYGVERLQQAVVDHRGGGPREVVDAILREVRTHTHGRTRDDITLFALQRV